MTPKLCVVVRFVDVDSQRIFRILIRTYDDVVLRINRHLRNTNY